MKERIKKQENKRRRLKKVQPGTNDYMRVLQLQLFHYKRRLDFRMTLGWGNL